MVINTPSNSSVTISLVCLKYPPTICGKSITTNLVYLQLSQIDVILEMNWLDFNRVHINCFSKTAIFLEVGGDGELMFISAKQV